MPKILTLNERLSLLSARFESRAEAQACCNALNGLFDAVEGQDGSFNVYVPENGALPRLSYQSKTYTFDEVFNKVREVRL